MKRFKGLAARVLLILIHCLPAAVCALRFGASPIWLPTSALLAGLLLLTLDATRTRFGRSAVALLSGSLLTVSLLLATSFYFQGEAFNARFFFHLDAGSLRIGLSEYRGPLFGATALVLLGLLAPALLTRDARRKPGAAALSLMWVAGLAVHYPVYAFFQYLLIGREPPAAPLPRTPAPMATAPAPDARPEPKNIILIYAESLERTFFDRASFGDLLPELSKLAPTALEFTDMVQEPGTGWTIGGIVASQCGFPLLQSNVLSSNSSMASADDPFADYACLADILAANGYRNVFLGGAPLWFAGKGKFLRAHGYHEVHGREELAARLDDPEYVSGWGLFDDSLFEIALDRVAELERLESPYLLTVLTVDTHHPNGHPSRSCAALADNKDPISNAIYCSDQLISAFVRETISSVDPDRTILVLFSDHLAMRNTLYPKLRQTRPRRLMFMIFGTGFEGEIGVRGNHFDVAPTILAAAGITGYETLYAGRNLLARAPVSAARPAAAPRLFPSGNRIIDTGVVISAAEQSIRIGEVTLRANAEGAEFSAGMYLAVFNERGELVDTVYSNDFSAILEDLTNRFVIGLSRFEDRPEQLSFFYGRLTASGEGFVIRPFQGEVTLEPSDLAAFGLGGES